MEKLEKLAKAILQGNSHTVVELINNVISNQYHPEKILEKGLIAGMEVVGKKFKSGEYFIPNVLMSAKAMNAAIEILEPYLLEANVQPKGKLLIGTVRGDLHDIGKTLVSIMFRGAGYKIIDLGTNVRSNDFIESAKKENPDIIGMSALLTTTMMAMEKNIELLRKENIIAPVIIGGAPTTQRYADSIHADYWAASASEGVDIIRNHSC